MILDQFKDTAPLHPSACIECLKPMTDLSRWDGQKKVVVWRCISRDCRLSIFKPHAMKSFAEMRMI